MDCRPSQLSSTIGDSQMPENIRRGAAILRVAIAFDDLTMRGMDHADALEHLSRNASLDQPAVQSLGTLPTNTANLEYRTLRIEDLATGMILQEEMRTTAGVLLVRRGQEITDPLAVRLVNFHGRKSIKDAVLVQCAKSEETHR